MAGDWIKFETATSDKPEVWVIASALSIDPDAVVGKLLRVWAWFDQHTESGNAKSVTKMLLDRNVGVTGFCDAVIASGWMTERDGEIQLPNFGRHNGKTAKTRVLTAKRVAAHKSNANDKGNDESVSDALPKEEKIITNTPISPNRKSKRKAKPLISISGYIENCKADGIKPIPEDDLIFEYARDIKLPHEFLRLGWYEFRDRMIESGKKYQDWPKAFRNYVRGGFLKLWWMNAQGEYELTTAGKQAQLLHGRAA